MKLAMGGDSSCVHCAGSGTVEGRTMTLACTHCRAHELAWQPYHDEQRRLWLAKQARGRA